MRAKLRRCAIVWSTALLATANACAVQTDEGLPPDAYAKVADVVIDEPWLQAARSELGGYARLRFRGHEGFLAFLGVEIDLELLHQVAQSEGYASDPRVTWREVEAVAARELAAEMERRVPRAQVEADRTALVAWLDEHRAEYTPAEQRSAWFASFPTWELAQAALDGLRSGRIDPATLKNTGETVLERRNDHDFPLFHRLLFDPKLHSGDWLPLPVYADQVVMAARVAKIAPGVQPTLEDPAVFAKVVDGVLAQRRQKAQKAYLQELLQRQAAAQ